MSLTKWLVTLGLVLALTIGVSGCGNCEKEVRIVVIPTHRASSEPRDGEARRAVVLKKNVLYTKTVLYVIYLDNADKDNLWVDIEKASKYEVGDEIEVTRLGIR